MTAVIATLEALTADALKTMDAAALARLEEHSDRLASLIDDEKERRNPAPATATNGENNLAALSKEFTAERMAAYRAQRALRRAIIQETVDYCATKPDLQMRLKDLFAFDLHELRPMAQDDAVK